MLRIDQRERAKIYIGRYIFGWTAILIAILTLVWRDVDIWQDLGSSSHRAVLIYIAIAVEILAGLTIQWLATARLGAVLIGAISFIFLLFCIPPIAAHPLVYFTWGNFFEVFSQVAAALIIFGTVKPTNSSRPSAVARIGYLCFGLCVVSYMLGQLFYLPLTASFVPRWIPPGRMFWAVTTTVGFGLAAVALLSGRLALLASRLLTAMLVGFALLVWLPALVANPHDLGNWTEGAQTVAIAAAAWVVADFLNQYRSTYKHTRSSEPVAARSQQ